MYKKLKLGTLGVSTFALAALNALAAPSKSSQIFSQQATSAKTWLNDSNGNWQVNSSIPNQGLLDLGVGSGSEFSFEISLSARYRVTPIIQIGGLFAFEAGGGTVGQIGAQGIYNFDTDLKNSYFAGLAPIVTFGDSSGFKIVAEGGKRFEIGKSISYEPALQYILILGDAGAGDRNDIFIKFASFSYTF